MEQKIYRGQTYQRVGEEPYRRKRDGVTTTLAVWLSECAECGRTFQFKTPNGGTFAPNRRCAQHQHPGAKVRSRRRK